MYTKMKCPRTTRTAGCSSSRSRSKNAGTVAREIGRFQNAGGDARCEHFAVPRAVIVVSPSTRILTTQNLANAFLHFLIRQPVAAGRHGVPLLTVLLMCIRV